MPSLRRIALLTAVTVAATGYVVFESVRSVPQVRERKRRLREERAAAARRAAA